MHDDDIVFSSDPAPWLELPATYPDTVASSGHAIGEVAREFGMTERALRFYEAKGLLLPQREGSVRRYGPRERDRLTLILKAKRLGFTLTEIRQMLAAGEPATRALSISRRQCVEQINLLEARKREIEAALAELRRSYSQSYARLASSG